MGSGALCPYVYPMTTASLRTTRRPVVPTLEAAERVFILVACLTLCVGGWWAFAQVILRVIA
jgi:hypothetical protein